jgi:SsrA-binding protein
MPKEVKNINIENRKARFNYEELESFEAGIKLTGTEIKSILDLEVSIEESYCLLTEGGIIIKNMYIKEYKFGNLENHEPRRDRVLLLNKAELNRLKRALIDRGLTVIPTKLYRNKRGLVKLEISLCKGKNLFDKKQVIKERDLNKQLKREL